MAGEKIIEGFSSKENVSEQHEWTKKQVEAELSSIKMNIVGFYESDGNNTDKIKYNLEAVKSYLWKLYEEIRTKDTKEAWSYLSQWTRQYAWIMAVQIALESLGEGWDTELNKIDWLLWKPGSRTRNAVKKFQEKYNEAHKSKLTPDWLPGKETIRAILEVLGWSVDSQWNDREEKPENSEVQIKNEIELLDWDVKAWDLVDLPKWATAEFENGKGIDKEKGGEQEIVVIVKVWDKVERITVVVIVDVENKKIKIDRKEEDKREHKEVEVGKKVKPKDLIDLKQYPNGTEVEFENGKWVDTTQAKKWVEVVVIVKVPGKDPVRVVVIVDVIGKIDDDENLENWEWNQDEWKESKENFSHNSYWEFDWKYLEWVEHGSTKIVTSVEELKKFLKISDLNDSIKRWNDDFFKTKNLWFKYIERPNTASQRYLIKSVDRVWSQVNVVYGDDWIDRWKYWWQMISGEILFVEIDKWNNVNWLKERGSKQRIVNLPENGNVKPWDLINLPDGGRAEYKNWKGVDKTKNWVQDVVVVVRVWDKVEELKVKVKVDVENGTLVIVKVDVEKSDVKVEKKENKKKVENMVLNDGYPKYFYTWEVDSKWMPHWKWKVKYNRVKYDDTHYFKKEWTYEFEWIWEHWKIVECTSYGNTLKIKYNSEWDAIFETASWKTLKVENINTDYVGETANIINYIFRGIKDSWGQVDHFYMNNDKHLRVKYEDGDYALVLKNAYDKMRVNYSEPLIQWLNEYKKEML